MEFLWERGILCDLRGEVELPGVIGSVFFLLKVKRWGGVV